jgi:HPt (histidine-containing phosphotransfer) domain-containing protein
LGVDVHVHVDRAALRELADLGGRDFVHEVVHAFIQDAQVDIAGMLASAARRDFKRMREHSHRVRGAAAYVGAHELNALCEQTSEFAKAGRFEKVEEYLGYVAQELKDVVADFGVAVRETVG